MQEEEVEELKERIHYKRLSEKRHNKILSLKEILERIGYGFVNPQFVNVFLFQSGATLFILGLVYGLKNLIAAIISSVIGLYARHHRMNTRVMSLGGIIFGFSFLFIAWAIVMKNIIMFAFALLLGTIGIVAYGDVYKKIANSVLSYEKRSFFLRKIAYFGIIITVISMLLSGYIIDLLPEKTFGNIKIYGYLISFEITAFCFIFAEFLITKIEDKRAHMIMSFSRFMKKEFISYMKKAYHLFKEYKVFLLLFTTIIITVLQIVGNAYYGVYIFNLFNGKLFGRFMNIAIIYSIAALISLLGYLFTTRVHKSTSITPHFILSVLLMAILPFVLVFNPHFLSISAAVSVMFLGGVIHGSSHNLLVKRIVHESSREVFYYMQAIFSFIPSLILIVFGSWFAEVLGMKNLFILIGACFVFIAAPLYLLLVILCEKTQNP